MPGLNVSLVKIDLGRVGSDLVDKVAKMFGKDSKTKELCEWVDLQTKLGINEASFVQAIAVGTPISIQSIYQPVRILGATRVQKARNVVVELSKKMSASDYLREPFNALLRAGPGWGKTTLLKILFISAAAGTDYVPLLFTLRKPNAVDDLEKLIGMLANLNGLRDKHLLLLVDGYDEISEEKQRRVSAALERYMALYCGFTILSCRSHYMVYDLSLTPLGLDSFKREDQIKFAEAYSTALGRPINAAALVNELQDRGLGDLLRHPLLLALVCVVKSGQPSTSISRSVSRLIQRALDTLSFRWDHERGVARDSQASTELDGHDRVQLLMYLAFHLELEKADEQEVFEHTRKFLRLLSWEKLHPYSVLIDCARFYGIFVPVGSCDWEFVHKTLYDYLAAKYWVETGKFDPARIKTWNTRAAYAASIIPDATQSMLAIIRKRNLGLVNDLLLNDPKFDYESVSPLLAKVLAEVLTDTLEQQENHYYLTGLTPDLITNCADKLLVSLVASALALPPAEGNPVIGQCVLELKRRKLRPTNELFIRLIERFEEAGTYFVLSSSAKVRLSELEPVNHDENQN